jgi:hypothetical protein
MNKKILKMRIQHNFSIVIVLVLSTIILSCKKDNPEPPTPQPTSGSVKVTLDHKWGPTLQHFAMETDLVHPATGETMSFTILNYYISNIKLKRADGTWWAQPESYYIVKVAEGTKAELTLNDVPVGDYTDIEYMIGVDSTRNVSGAQTGALSTTHNMFWGWTTGYIFIRAEGNSPQANLDYFSYHIGGFQKSNNTDAIRINTVPLGTSGMKVDGATTKSISFFVNVARIWHGGILLSETNSIHMPGAMANTIADNFQGAFVFDKIQ